MVLHAFWCHWGSIDFDSVELTYAFFILNRGLLSGRFILYGGGGG